MSTGDRGAGRAVARARKVPMGARKARRVVDLIRGRSVEEALTILRFAPYAAAGPVAKVVASAAANAEHNFDLDRDTLVISQVYADEGGRPIMGSKYRIRQRAQGRGYRERKHTCHITVEVESRPERAPRARTQRGAKGRAR